MGKTIAILLLGIFLLSCVSADIIMSQPRQEIYNLGDTLLVPITIKATNDVSGILEINLVCNGNEVKFYRNGVNLAYGEEAKISPAPSIPLLKSIIGNIVGQCKVKAELGEENVLSEEFRISKLITVSIDEPEEEFIPGEIMIIEGEAVKENEKSVEGFIEAQIQITNTTNNDTELFSVNNGFFTIEMPIEEDMKAGEHALKLKAYEIEPSGEKTNTGHLTKTIYIKQIPKNLEIYLEENQIEPGTNMKAKALLRDQTGENIQATALITIKNSKGKIIEQKEVSTDEFFEYPIEQNEPPLEWEISAESEELSSIMKVNIDEKEDISVELTNKTLTVKNIGNVIYCNKTLLIKIGENSENIDVCLEVGKEEKYQVKAPDGEYTIEIISGGESVAKQEGVPLTGKAVSIEKASQGVVSLVRYPLAWIFLIIVLGMIAFLIFKKGYKRTFFGYLPRKSKKERITKVEKGELKPLRRDSLIKTTKRAVLSLSLKGEKQRATIIGLKIKNLKEVESKKTNVEENLQKIVQLVEEKNGFVYENSEYIFFIFTPSITKTFRNEKIAIQAAKTMQKILGEHNKLFKSRIEHGLSVHQGEIVAKYSNGELHFMSINTLIPQAKKLSSMSTEEVIISKEVNSKLSSDVKTEKREKDGTEFYTIKEIIDRGEHKQFISSFLKKLEEEKKRK
jgi:hypothetical protein